MTGDSTGHCFLWLIIGIAWRLGTHNRGHIDTSCWLEPVLHYVIWAVFWILRSTLTRNDINKGVEYLDIDVLE